MAQPLTLGSQPKITKAERIGIEEGREEEEREGRSGSEFVGGQFFETKLSRITI